MRVLETPRIDFKDVLIVPQLSELNSRSEVSLSRKIVGKHSKIEFECCPIIASNMDTTGTIKMADTLHQEGCMVALHKFYGHVNVYSERTRRPNLSFITIGLSKPDRDRYVSLLDSHLQPEFICIDVANGYMQGVRNFVGEVRSKYPGAFIMAGNVCTSTATVRLIEAGADCVKIGIGPGELCRTRSVTGCGYPQLSAIIECSSAAHKLGGYVCADGGCKETGDICKAFVGGADFVMLGSMLMGFDECEGEWKSCTENYVPPDAISMFDVLPTTISARYLRVYGMSSEEAMDKYYEGKAPYRASEGGSKWVRSKGAVLPFIREIKGGIRSCCAYVGAHNIKDLSKCGDFVRV